MKKSPALSLVRQIMMEFAEQTGLLPVGRLPHRYLWTDAFAVCNFLKLYRLTGDDSYKSLALSLVDQVHETLGRYSENYTRRGWISGLSADQGRLHPTAGGLRIGKKMNERGRDEPYDEKMEWDRDGQYYHYLTKLDACPPMRRQGHLGRGVLPMGRRACQKSPCRPCLTPLIWGWKPI